MGVALYIIFSLNTLTSLEVEAVVAVEDTVVVVA